MKKWHCLLGFDVSLLRYCPSKSPETPLWGTFVIGFEIFSLVSTGYSNDEVSKNDIVW